MQSKYQQHMWAVEKGYSTLPNLRRAWLAIFCLIEAFPRMVAEAEREKDMRKNSSGVTYSSARCGFPLSRQRSQQPDVAIIVINDTQTTAQIILSGIVNLLMVAELLVLNSDRSG